MDSQRNSAINPIPTCKSVSGISQGAVINVSTMASHWSHFSIGYYEPKKNLSDYNSTEFHTTVQSL